MKIHYHNRKPLNPSQAGDATYVSFDDLLSTSDVISLNLSLNASTRHIIGAPEFKKMRDGVIIINTARGKLIDEAALVSALESGKVFSAGLDVYEEEPTIHEGLLKSDKVVLLPHIGTATFETQVSVNPCTDVTCCNIWRFTNLVARRRWNVSCCRIFGAQYMNTSLSLRSLNRQESKKAARDENQVPCFVEWRMEIHKRKRQMHMTLRGSDDIASC